MSRYPIKRSRYWSWALPVIGATEDRAFIEIDSLIVAVQFGIKRIEIPRRDIISAERSSWPWWGGIGWRTNMWHSIGLLGAFGPILLIRIKPQRTRGIGFSRRLTKIYLSVDDPYAIIREISS